MRALFLACLLGISAGALPAAAQSPEAERLFERGLEAMKDGDYQTACPALESSHRLEPRVGALFTLAECEARADRLGSAWHHFGAFLEQVTQLPPDERKQQAKRVEEAKRRRGELEPLLSRLVIEVPTDLPPAAAVERNGEPVARSDWGRAMVVNAGPQHVVLRLPDGRVVETSIELPRKETRSVRVSASAELPAISTPAPMPSPSPKSPRDTGPGAQRVVGWIGVGLGAAGLIAAGVATGILLDKKSVVDDNCEGSVCNQEGLDATEDVPTLSVVGTIGVAVGLAGIAVGTILLLTAPDQEASAQLGWRLTAAPSSELGIGVARTW